MFKTAESHRNPYEKCRSYREIWKQYRDSFPSQVVIRDLAFCKQSTTTDQNHGDILYLLACTEMGQICIWKMPTLRNPNDEDDDCDAISDDGSAMNANDEHAMELEEDHGDENKASTTSPRPLCRFQVTKTGPLYSIRVMDEPTNNNNRRVTLIAAGQGGVWLYDWNKDIAPLLVGSSSGRPPVSHAVQPLSHFSLHPSPGGIHQLPSVYETTSSGNFLYGAAGDAFECYKWDLAAERLVTTYTDTKSKQQSLRSVQAIPNSNLILTGGTAGVLGIWDVAKDCVVEQLDLQEHLSPPQRPSASNRRSSSSNNNNKVEYSYDISSIVVRDENWWMVGGGITSATTTNGTSTSRSGTKSNTGGFLATWHGPTRSLVAQTTARRERPQTLLYSSSHDALLSGANESFVTKFDHPLELLASEDPQRIRCDPPSTYAVVESPQYDRMAVAGVGPVINIFRGGTLLVNTLRL